MVGVQSCARALDGATVALLRGSSSAEPSCFWPDGHTLLAQLHVRTALTTASRVRVRDGVLAPASLEGGCPHPLCAEGDGLGATLDATAPCGAGGACPTPVALASAPAELSDCPGATLTVDASGSSTGGIGPPRYEWRVDEAMTTSNAAALDAFARSRGAHDAVMTIGSSLLPAAPEGGESVFAFTLVVVSFLGVRSAPTSVVVRRSSRGPIPTVRIDGPSVRRARSSVPLAVSASALLAPCWQDAALVDFSWAVEPAPALSIAPYAAGGRLSLPPGALYAGRSYALTVRGAMASRPSAYAEATVLVIVRHEALVATIAGGNRRAQASRPITLDARRSADPSVLPPAERAPLAFEWTLSRWPSVPSSADGERVVALPDGAAGGALVTLPTGWLPAGSYVATVRVSSADGRSATASASLEVVLLPVPTVVLETLGAGKASADERLSVRVLRVTLEDAEAATAALVLAGLATSAADAAARGISSALLPWVYAWDVFALGDAQSGAEGAPPASVAAAPLDLADPTVSSTGGARPNLVLLPGALAPGAVYALQLTVSTAGVQPEAVTLRVAINRPPYGGELRCEPLDGEAATTRFELSAVGWTDDDENDLPLRYSFAYRALEHGADESALLGELRLDASAGVFLSAGEWALLVRVTDQHGAAALADAASTVRVAPARLTDATLTDMMSTIDLAAAIGESDVVHQVVRALADGMARAVDGTGDYCANGTLTGSDAADAAARANGSAPSCELLALASARGARTTMLGQLLRAQQGMTLPSLTSVRLWAESVAAVIRTSDQLDADGQLLGAAYVQLLANASTRTGVDERSATHMAASLSALLVADARGFGADGVVAERDGLVADAARTLGVGLLVGALAGEAAREASAELVAVSVRRALAAEAGALLLGLPGGGVGGVRLGTTAIAAVGAPPAGVDVRMALFSADVHASEYAAARAAVGAPSQVNGTLGNASVRASNASLVDYALASPILALALGASADGGGAGPVEAEVRGLAPAILILLPYEWAAAAAQPGPAGEAGDCSDWDGCSRRGACVRGGCACDPPWEGPSCRERVACHFWDEASLAWSAAGVATVGTAAEAAALGVAAPPAGTLGCLTTHLTDFGGLRVPTSLDEVRQDVESIAVNTLSLSDVAVLRTPGALRDSPWIYGLVFGIAALNAFLLFVAFFVDRRMRVADAKAAAAVEPTAAGTAGDTPAARAPAKWSERARRCTAELVDGSTPPAPSHADVADGSDEVACARVSSTRGGCGGSGAGGGTAAAGELLPSRKASLRARDLVGRVANSLEVRLDQVDAAARDARLRAALTIERHARGWLQRRAVAHVRALRAEREAAAAMAASTEHRLTRWMRQLGDAIIVEHTLLALWTADGTTSLRTEHVQVLLNTLLLQLLLGCVLYSDEPSDGTTSVLQLVLIAALTAGISAPALVAFKLSFALSKDAPPRALDRLFRGLKKLAELPVRGASQRWSSPRTSNPSAGWRGVRRAARARGASRAEGSAPAGANGSCSAERMAESRMLRALVSPAKRAHRSAAPRGRDRIVAAPPASGEPAAAAAGGASGSPRARHAPSLGPADAVGAQHARSVPERSSAECAGASRAVPREEGEGEGGGADDTRPHNGPVAAREDGSAHAMPSEAHAADAATAAAAAAAAAATHAAAASTYATHASPDPPAPMALQRLSGPPVRSPRQLAGLGPSARGARVSAAVETLRGAAPRASPPPSPPATPAKGTDGATACARAPLPGATAAPVASAERRAAVSPVSSTRSAARARTRTEPVRVSAGASASSADAPTRACLTRGAARASSPSRRSRHQTEESMAAVRGAMRYVDTDGSGALNMAELRALLLHLGEEVQPHELDAVFQRLDRDGDGRIDFDELERWLRKRKLVRAARAIRLRVRLKAPRGGEAIRLKAHLHLRRICAAAGACARASARAYRARATPPCAPRRRGRWSTRANDAPRCGAGASQVAARAWCLRGSSC